MSLVYTKISKESFDSTLSRYPSTVSTPLLSLDTLRYTTIPDSLASRKASGDAYLDKSSVEKLVEWKLKHGTFRPKLLQLVQSNDDALVEETTRKAFAAGVEEPLAATKVLTALKGIGPATASLLLSVYAPTEVPFFSDELFRWVMWEEKGAPGGWKRVIRYNNKEYEELARRVGEVAGRLGVDAVDLERVAWVLGKEGIDINAEGDDRKGSKSVATEANEKEASKGKDDGKAVAKKGAKRKAAEMKPPTEATRRRSRRRTES